MRQKASAFLSEIESQMSRFASSFPNKTHILMNLFPNYTDFTPIVKMILSSRGRIFKKDINQPNRAKRHPLCTIQEPSMRVHKSDAAIPASAINETCVKDCRGFGINACPTGTGWLCRPGSGKVRNLFFDKMFRTCLIQTWRRAGRENLICANVTRISGGGSVFGTLPAGWR